MKNKEMKIYELLGIKKFRKLVFNFVYILLRPFFRKLPKEEIKKVFLNIPTNYVMKKGNGLQDLRDFKNMLLFNSLVHIAGLIHCTLGLVSAMAISSFALAIPFLFLSILNIYCIMLQRYNHIKINLVLNKHKQKQKEKFCDEIKKDKHLSKEYSYKTINKNNKEKNITFEKFLNIATPEQLIEYRKFLIKSSSYDNKDKNCLEMDIDKRKKLILEYKTKH